MLRTTFLLLLLLPLHSAQAAGQSDLLSCFENLELNFPDGVGNTVHHLENGPATPLTVAVAGQRKGVDGFYLYTEGSTYFIDSPHEGPGWARGNFQVNFNIPKRSSQVTCGYTGPRGPSAMQRSNCWTTDPSLQILKPEWAILIDEKKEDAQGYLRAAILSRIDGILPRVQDAFRDYKKKAAAHELEVAHHKKFLGIFEIPGITDVGVAPRMPSKDAATQALEGCRTVEDENVRTAAVATASIIQNMAMIPRDSAGTPAAQCP